jgi:uncharacterized protein
VADYFFDTSALVKAYIAEIGTTWVRQILDNPQHRIWIAALTKVEVVAALTRRFHVGDLTQQQLNQGSSDALQDCADFLAVPIIIDVIDRAVALAQRYNLRTYDAVQLSTAMEARDALLTNLSSPIDFTVVSADMQLNQAAQLRECKSKILTITSRLNAIASVLPRYSGLNRKHLITFQIQD